MNRKLLFVIQPHESGATHRLPLIKGAAEAGYEVSVATLAGSDAWEILTVEKIRLYAVPLSRSGTNPIKEIRLIWSLMILFRTIRPDIINNVSIKPVAFGGAAIRFLNFFSLKYHPVVISTFPGLGYIYSGRDSKNSLLRFLVNKLYGFALSYRRTVAIFHNDDDRALLKGAGVVEDAGSMVIPGSGVDIEHFIPMAEEEGEVLVAMPARMLWDKGVGEFVEAARRLRDEGVPARFVLTGGVDPENPHGIVEKRLGAWVQEGLVEWWGHVTDMRTVYRAAHIVVLPSYREGFPKVLLEAAAAARPVVTTEAPGCRDAVIDGETGYLVPVKDSAALADRIACLLADPALRVSMGRAARRRVEAEFSTDRVVKDTLAVFDKLLERCRS